MKKALMFAVLMINYFQLSALAWPWPSYENECKINRISEIVTTIPKSPQKRTWVEGRFVYFEKCKNAPHKFKAFVPETLLEKVAQAQDNGAYAKGSIRTGVWGLFNVLYRVENL